jgi:hypothetical protein
MKKRALRGIVSVFLVAAAAGAVLLAAPAGTVNVTASDPCWYEHCTPITGV